jgi:hypothetical protein
MLKINVLVNVITVIIISVISLINISLLGLIRVLDILPIGIVLKPTYYSRKPKRFSYSN